MIRNFECIFKDLLFLKEKNGLNAWCVILCKDWQTREAKAKPKEESKNLFRAYRDPLRKMHIRLECECNIILFLA